MEKKKGLVIGVIVLAALVAVFLIVYNMAKPKPSSGSSSENQQTAADNSNAQANADADNNEAEGSNAEGGKHITIEVKSADGSIVSYDVATDADYLRQAMDEADGLTYSGTESEYGMMVEVVNGEQAVYAEDNAYWAFYVNGEYGQYGIDTQPVNDGDKYSIVYESAVAYVEEGSKHITIEVTGADGTTVTYEVATDADYLRQAMDETEGLTYSGTESEYGMMVEIVNGEQAIYAEDNAYWAFYVDGEYGQYGIDSQPVEDGSTYSIVYEAA